MKKAGWKPKKGIVEPKPQDIAGLNRKDGRGVAKMTDFTDGQPAAAAAKIIPAPDTARANAPEQPQTPSTDLDELYANVDLTSPRIYERAAWKHVVHWLFFSLVAFFDVAVLSELVWAIFFSNHQVTAVRVTRGVLAEAIFLSLNLLIMPSLLLEANRVELRQDRLLIWSLIWRSSIPWKDVKSVTNPFYLKFAIIKTPRFFQLINKRDIKQFDELLAIVKAKVHHASR